MNAGTYRFVRIPDVESYLQLGWMPTPALEGISHGNWSVLCRWICACPVPQPIMKAN